MYIHTYVYIYICIHTCIRIYIYIYRERERYCGRVDVGRVDIDSDVGRVDVGAAKVISDTILHGRNTRNAKLGARHTLYVKRYALYSAHIYSAHISGQLTPLAVNAADLHARQQQR